ncbi:MAG TPA: exopolysaccharide biosynthesis polyprenyl glycosylphosphotransferase [Chryseosolibacter sp.]
MEERYYPRFLRTLLCAGDAVLLYIAFFIARQLNLFSGFEDDLTSFYLIFAFSWIATALFSLTYEISRYSLMRSIGINLATALLFHFLMIAGVQAYFEIVRLDLKALLGLYLVSGTILAASRVAYKLIGKFIEFSGFDVRKVVIVGTTRSGRALYDFFTSGGPSGYIFRGFFDDYPNPLIVNRKLVKGTIDDLMTYCQQESIDEIYYTLPLAHGDLLDRLSKFADDNCIYFRIASDFSEVVRNSHNVYLYNSVAVSTTRKEPLRIGVNAAVKRIFDVVFSSIVIFGIFPFIVPFIALAIKLDSPGPVIFKQLRPGKRNKLFDCYKFRTMRVNNSTERMATKNDSRITKVGAFLRKTSLDELPQFVNVLLGSMSVVGPRPNLVSQLEEYSRTLRKYKVRHFVTPGITGYAQVNGYRGEIKEKGSMEKRVDMDVAYMENWSLMLDVKIILQTMGKIIHGDKQAY